MQPNKQVAPKTIKQQTHQGKTNKNMAKSLDLSKQAWTQTQTHGKGKTNHKHA